jgi:hypothetical protein
VAEGTRVFGASKESGQFRKTEEFTSTNAMIMKSGLH